MPADLHIHTNCSDGIDSPEKIVELAKAKGLTTIAITDHDGVAGIEPAQKKGKELGIEIIPGIEFTTEEDNKEIHVLGFYIDIKQPELLEITGRMQKNREERIFKICEKLNGLGVKLAPKKIFELSGSEAVGRPHVARVLVSEGHVADFKEAFRKYLGFGGPAYVAHFKLSPEDAVKLIVANGGIAVFAHPAVSNDDEVIPKLIKAGLRGIEVFYSSHSQSQTDHYKKLAAEYGLLMTGGSDYHGVECGKKLELGDFTIKDELVDKLKNEYLRRN